MGATVSLFNYIHMLDIHFIRANVDMVKAAVQNKKLIHRVDVDALLKLDQELSGVRKNKESLLQERNVLDTAVKSAQEKDAKMALIEKGKLLKDQIKVLDEQMVQLQVQFDELMLQLPNVTSPLMPMGKGEEENVVARSWGTAPTFSFTPRDHVDLGKMLDIIDCETSGEISGSRFYYLKGAAVRIQFAIVQFVFETLGNAKIE